MVRHAREQPGEGGSGSWGAKTERPRLVHAEVAPATPPATAAGGADERARAGGVVVHRVGARGGAGGFGHHSRGSRGSGPGVRLMLTARPPQCSRCNRLLPWPDVERGDKVCSNCREPVDPPAELTQPVDAVHQLLLRARVVDEEVLPVIGAQLRLAVVREVHTVFDRMPNITSMFEALNLYEAGIRKGGEHGS